MQSRTRALVWYRIPVCTLASVSNTKHAVAITMSTIMPIEYHFANVENDGSSNVSKICEAGAQGQTGLDLAWRPRSSAQAGASQAERTCCRMVITLPCFLGLLSGPMDVFTPNARGVSAEVLATTGSSSAGGYGAILAPPSKADVIRNGRAGTSKRKAA